jgi:hypothetical protein
LIETFPGSEPKGADAMTPHPSPQERRVDRLAKLFDLRTFIGSLFAVFGLIVTVDGLMADRAEIAKAAGINLSLWTGLAMLALAAVFLIWLFASPPQPYEGHGSSDDDVPEQLRRQRPGH